MYCLLLALLISSGLGLLRHGTSERLLREANAKFSIGSDEDACSSLLQTSALSQPHVKQSQSHVKFLRIQKTAGTSFGEYILPALCSQVHQTCEGSYHLDWNHVQDAQHILVFLRHPVQRFISEFKFYGEPFSPSLMHQNQWDFIFSPRKDDIFDILGRGDNILDFLATPGNPARNRQTLYLAGFKPPGKFESPGFPPASATRDGFVLHLGGRNISAFDIDWEHDGQEVLALAMQHLEDPRVMIGIDEDYECSVDSFADALGWNVSEVHALSQIHFRSHSSESDLDARTLHTIETMLAADMALYRRARNIFNSRRSLKCD